MFGIFFVLATVKKKSDFGPWNKKKHPWFRPPHVAGCLEVCFGPSESTLVQTCFCLPDPTFVCTTRIQMCAHVKDPISICRKSAHLTARGVERRKHCIHEKLKQNQKTWVAPYYGCSLSPWTAARIARANCFA